MRELEDELGVRLLERSSRALLEVAPRPVLRLGSKAVIRDAVLAGAALVPSALVGPDVDGGRLARVGVVAGSAVSLSLVYPAGRPVSGRLRAFIDLVVRTTGARPPPAARARRPGPAAPAA